MANTDGPWIRFYASDWLAGTRGMTAAETGVYITLIATMYEKAEPLPRDDSRLARLCGLPTRNFTQILDRLIADSKISLDEHANLWGRKVDLEVRNRIARAEKSRNAALAKHEQKQRPNSAKAQSKQPPSSAPEVPRARGSEPEPDSKDIESLEAKKGKARGSRLPTDWEIPNDWGRWAVEEFGVSSGAVRTEAAKFRDYWCAKTGAQATKLDWLATWRNWCRTAFAPKAASARRSSNRPLSAAELSNQLLQEMEAADERRSETERNQSPLEQHAITGPRGRSD